MTKKEMTPLHVEILIWYYCHPNDFPNLDAQGVKSAIKDLCDAGVLYMNPAVHKNKVGYHQSALDVYMDAVLSVPLPKQIWICEITHE